MGGGDKIVLNISKEIKSKYNIVFLCCPEGKLMVKRELGVEVEKIQINNTKVGSSNFIYSYFLRILNINYIFQKEYRNADTFWSSSDFLPDTLPGMIGKLFFRKKWYGNLFLRARNPFAGELPISARTVLYFLSQQLTILFYKYFSDGVFVLSKNDQKYLQTKGLKQINILSGGVNLSEIDDVHVSTQKYDACYVGRFHYQKGLPQLIKIWSTINRNDKKYKLAIVGWGIPEEVGVVKALIEKYRVQETVSILGYLDGVEKYKIIKESKLLLFPSTFESWGVVIAESIACGTPVIAFKIPDIYQNFPNGVVWIESGNIKKYQETIIQLLRNKKEREKVSEKSFKNRFIYDWKNSANIFLASTAK